MVYGEIIIEIDEIVGNAFISCLKKNGKRTLPFKRIDEFALKVVEQLNEKGKKARLQLSREADNEFFHRYSEWFKRAKTEDGLIVIVDDSVTIMKLFKQFSTNLSLEVLSVFEDPENTKVLLE